MLSAFIIVFACFFLISRYLALTEKLHTGRNIRKVIIKKTAYDYQGKARYKRHLMHKINIAQKLALFNDHWNPRIVAELNGQHVKLVKFQGEFVWHKHDHEDEMFLVIKGKFKMEFRDRTIEINENEFIVVPRGVEHRPVAAEEVSVMLFEPAGTLNTGDTKGELTRENLKKI